MSRLSARLLRLGRSLYARIVLVFLASLLLLSVAAAWIAISQFGQLTQEMQQRMQLGLAQNIATVLHAPLAQGVASKEVQQSVQQVLSINPSLSLYLLDASGRVIGNFTDAACPPNAQVNLQPLTKLLHQQAMLPLRLAAPCSHQDSIFSVAPLNYGAEQQPGYLLVLLGGDHHMSMFAMLRTSSITHTLILSGLLALIVSGILGLLLFALLTRRFTYLTRAVQRFADGDYQQRIPPSHDDEIGRLGQVFNHLAATIETQLDALRENDRQRRQLITGLSHDFRTPLTSLRGFAERLHAGTPPDDDALNAILANTQRLTQLAGQLSALARVDTYEEALSLEPFSLAELAYDVAGKFAPQAQAAGVTLKVDAQPGTTRVLADLALIDRALANLIDNALHATPAGGEIELKVHAQGKQADISVTDTGVGLATEEIPLVTQRFYRTPAGRARSDGSGLGLAIVAEVCAHHGTRLNIHSQPGCGTRMSFQLPLAVTMAVSEKPAGMD